MSGWTNGSIASDAGFAPTSSSATPQPAARAAAAAVSRADGCAATARSVISVTTRSRSRAPSAHLRRSAGQSVPSAIGSVLTNRVTEGSSPAASAASYARERQIQSSSASRPAACAAVNSTAGLSQRVPAGPRLSAS
jgi:hypothetical protein